MTSRLPPADSDSDSSTEGNLNAAMGGFAGRIGAPRQSLFGGLSYEEMMAKARNVVSASGQGGMPDGLTHSGRRRSANDSTTEANVRQAEYDKDQLALLRLEQLHDNDAEADRLATELAERQALREKTKMARDLAENKRNASHVRRRNLMLRYGVAHFKRVEEKRVLSFDPTKLHPRAVAGSVLVRLRDARDQESASIKFDGLKFVFDLCVRLQSVTAQTTLDREATALLSEKQMQLMQANAAQRTKNSSLASGMSASTEEAMIAGPDADKLPSAGDSKEEVAVPMSRTPSTANVAPSTERKGSFAPRSSRGQSVSEEFVDTTNDGTAPLSATINAPPSTGGPGKAKISTKLAQAQIDDITVYVARRQAHMAIHSKEINASYFVRGVSIFLSALRELQLVFELDERSKYNIKKAYAAVIKNPESHTARHNLKQVKKVHQYHETMMMRKVEKLIKAEFAHDVDVGIGADDDDIFTFVFDNEGRQGQEDVASTEEASFSFRSDDGYRNRQRGGATQESAGLTGFSAPSGLLSRSSEIGSSNTKSSAVFGKDDFSSSVLLNGTSSVLLSSPKALTAAAKAQHHVAFSPAISLPAQTQASNSVFLPSASMAMDGSITRPGGDTAYDSNLSNRLLGRNNSSSVSAGAVPPLGSFHPPSASDNVQHQQQVNRTNTMAAIMSATPQQAMDDPTAAAINHSVAMAAAGDLPDHDFVDDGPVATRQGLAALFEAIDSGDVRRISWAQLSHFLFEGSLMERVGAVDLDNKEYELADMSAKDMKSNLRIMQNLAASEKEIAARGIQSKALALKIKNKNQEKLAAGGVTGGVADGGVLNDLSQIAYFEPTQQLLVAGADLWWVDKGAGLKTKMKIETQRDAFTLLPVYSIISTAYQPSIRLLALSCTDSTIKFYHISAGNVVAPKFLMSYAFQCNQTAIFFRGEVLYSGSRDGELLTFQMKYNFTKGLAIAKGAQAHPHKNIICKIIEVKHEKCIVTCSLDHTVQMHDAKSLKHVHTFGPTHPRGVVDMAYSEALNVLVSIAYDGIPYVWSLSLVSGPPSPLLDGTKEHKHVPVAVVSIDKHHTAATLDRGGMVKIWDLKELVCTQTIHITSYLPPAEQGIRFVDMIQRWEDPAPNAPLGCLTLYVISQRRIFTLVYNQSQSKVILRNTADDEPVLHAAWCPWDLSYLSISTNTVRTWDGESCAIRDTFKRPKEVHVTGLATAATSHPVGRQYYLGTADGSILAKSTSTGMTVFEALKVHTSAVKLIHYCQAPIVPGIGANLALDAVITLSEDKLILMSGELKDAYRLVDVEHPRSVAYDTETALLLVGDTIGTITAYQLGSFAPCRGGPVGTASLPKALPREITAMCVLQGEQAFAAADDEGHIAVFNQRTHDRPFACLAVFTHVNETNGIPAITCMLFDADRYLLYCGDEQGFITIYNMYDMLRIPTTTASAGIGGRSPSAGAANSRMSAYARNSLLPTVHSTKVMDMTRRRLSVGPAAAMNFYSAGKRVSIINRWLAHQEAVTSLTVVLANSPNAKDQQPNNTGAMQHACLLSSSNDQCVYAWTLSGAKHLGALEQYGRATIAITSYNSAHDFRKVLTERAAHQRDARIETMRVKLDGLVKVPGQRCVSLIPKRWLQSALQSSLVGSIGGHLLNPLHFCGKTVAAASGETSRKAAAFQVFLAEVPAPNGVKVQIPSPNASVGENEGFEETNMTAAVSNVAMDELALIAEIFGEVPPSSPPGQQLLPGTRVRFADEPSNLSGATNTKKFSHSSSHIGTAQIPSPYSKTQVSTTATVIETNDAIRALLSMKEKEYTQLLAMATSAGVRSVADIQSFLNFPSALTSGATGLAKAAALEQTVRARERYITTVAKNVGSWHPSDSSVVGRIEGGGSLLGSFGGGGTLLAESDVAAGFLGCQYIKKGDPQSEPLLAVNGHMIPGVTVEDFEDYGPSMLSLSPIIRGRVEEGTAELGAQLYNSFVPKSKTFHIERLHHRRIGAPVDDVSRTPQQAGLSSTKYHESFFRSRSKSKSDNESDNEDDHNGAAVVTSPIGEDVPAFKSSFLAFGETLPNGNPTAIPSSSLPDKPMRLIDVIDTISAEVAEIRMMKIRVMESARLQSLGSPRGGRRAQANDPWARTLRRKEASQMAMHSGNASAQALSLTPDALMMTPSATPASVSPQPQAIPALQIPTATEIFELEQKMLQAKADHNTYYAHLFVSNDLQPYPDDMFDLKRGFIGRIGAAASATAGANRLMTNYASIFNGRSLHNTVALSSLDLTSGSARPRQETLRGQQDGLTSPIEPSSQVQLSPRAADIPPHMQAEDSACPALLLTEATRAGPSVSLGSASAFLGGLAAIDAREDAGDAEKCDPPHASDQGNEPFNATIVAGSSTTASGKEKEELTPDLGADNPEGGACSPPQSILSASTNFANTIVSVLSGTHTFNPPLSPSGGAGGIGKSLADRYRTAQLDAGDLAVPAPRRFAGLAVDDEGIPIVLNTAARKTPTSKKDKGKGKVSHSGAPDGGRRDYRLSPSKILSRVQHDPKLKIGGVPISPLAGPSTAPVATAGGLTDEQLREIQKAHYPPMGTHQTVVPLRNKSFDESVTRSPRYNYSQQQGLNEVSPVRSASGQNDQNSISGWVAQEGATFEGMVLMAHQADIFNKIGDVVDSVRAAVAPNRQGALLRKGMGFGGPAPAITVFRRPDGEDGSESVINSVAKNDSINVTAFGSDSSNSKIPTVLAFEGGYASLPIIAKHDIMSEHRRRKGRQSTSASYSKKSRKILNEELDIPPMVDTDVNGLPNDSSVVAKEIRAKTTNTSLATALKERILSRRRKQETTTLAEECLAGDNDTLSRVVVGRAAADAIQMPSQFQAINGAEFRRPEVDTDLFPELSQLKRANNDQSNDGTRPMTALSNASTLGKGQNMSTLQSISFLNSSNRRQNLSSDTKVPGSSEGARVTPLAPTHRLDQSMSMNGVITAFVPSTTVYGASSTLSASSHLPPRSSSAMSTSTKRELSQSRAGASTKETPTLSRPGTSSNSRHKQAIQDASSSTRTVLLLNEPNGPKLGAFPVRAKGHSGPIMK